MLTISSDAKDCSSVTGDGLPVPPDLAFCGQLGPVLQGLLWPWK